MSFAPSLLASITTRLEGIGANLGEADQEEIAAVVSRLGDLSAQLMVTTDPSEREQIERDLGWVVSTVHDWTFVGHEVARRAVLESMAEVFKAAAANLMRVAIMAVPK